MKTAMPHIPEILGDELYDALVERVKFRPGTPGWEDHADHIQAQGWDLDAFLNYRDWVERNFGTNYIKLMTEHFYPIIPIWDVKNASATEPAEFWHQDNREYVPEAEFLVQARGATVAWVRENCKLTTG